MTPKPFDTREEMEEHALFYDQGSEPGDCGERIDRLEATVDMILDKYARHAPRCAYQEQSSSTVEAKGRCDCGLLDWQRKETP